MKYINQIHVLFGSELSHKGKFWWGEFLKNNFNVDSFHTHIYTLNNTHLVKHDLRPILILNIGNGYYHGDLKSKIYDILVNNLDVSVIGERPIFIHVTDKSNLDLLCNGALHDLLFHHYHKDMGLMKNIKKEFIYKLLEE